MLAPDMLESLSRALKMRILA